MSAKNNTLKVCDFCGVSEIDSFIHNPLNLPEHLIEPLKIIKTKDGCFICEVCLIDEEKLTEQKIKIAEKLLDDWTGE